MAQAGAQREPSMEEILASIRKIIENNDTDREQPSVAQAAPRREPAFSEVAEAPTASQTQPQPRPEAAEAKAPAGNGEDATTGSLSLADIAARMRNDKQAPVGTVLDDSTAQDLQDLLDDEKLDYGMPVSRRDEDELQEVARAIAGMTPGFDDEADSVPVAQAAPAESAAPEPDHDTVAEEQGDPAGAADAGLSGLGQLVSVETGEKVAQSFAELDAALAAGSQRKFDEIAEELLRPMLQNWLDDNLPTMVERLIREEIERVSRGTRR